MKYTKDLLLHILQEGGAELVGEYERFNQRMYVKFKCKCGNQGEKKFEMLNVYRYPYCDECSLKLKEEKRVKTCIEKYGVINTAQLEEVKNKIQNTFDEKFGDHPKRTKEVHQKWLNTCNERFGGHPNQNREVQVKAEKNAFKFKEYTFPSGKIIKYQGYENLALDELIKLYNENDIICGRAEIPSFTYYTGDRKHIYYPDFYIQSTNTIIEVKSDWTFKQPRACIEERAEAVKKEGYKFEVWLYKGNRKELSVLTY